VLVDKDEHGADLTRCGGFWKWLEPTKTIDQGSGAIIRLFCTLFPDLPCNDCGGLNWKLRLATPFSQNLDAPSMDVVTPTGLHELHGNAEFDCGNNGCRGEFLRTRWRSLNVNFMPATGCENLSQVSVEVCKAFSAFTSYKPNCSLDWYAESLSKIGRTFGRLKAVNVKVRLHFLIF
jgi:hypothetical protein